MDTDRADSAARNAVDSGVVAGIAASFWVRGEVSESCFGLLDRDGAKPVRPDSIMRIHSLTKPVIGAAVLMLQERGQLDLEDPIERWMPRFARRQPGVGSPSSTAGGAAEITIRHLLTHTSGLAYGIGAGDLEERYQAAGLFTPALGLGHPLPVTVDLVSQLPTAFEPGADWRYSIAFDLLGHLVELVTESPLGEFLERELFAPLGMVDTGFNVPRASRDRFGPLYGAQGTEPQILDPAADSAYLNPEVVPSGGGGLVSTVRDYLRFARMLQGGGSVDGVRILDPATVRSMTSNQLVGAEFPVRWDFISANGSVFSIPNLGYGYGIGVDEGPQLRVGWAGASGCQMWIYPAQDLVAVVFTQSLGDFTASDAVLAALVGP